LWKSISSSEDDEENPTRYYINNFHQGARKHFIYRVLSWVKITVLGIFSGARFFPYKQNYISFLKLSNNWNAACYSIFSRSKSDAQKSQRVLSFISQWSCPYSGHIGKQSCPQTSPVWHQTSYTWTLEGFFFCPTSLCFSLPKDVTAAGKRFLRAYE
jgi:hypothetical protein